MQTGKHMVKGISPIQHFGASSLSRRTLGWLTPDSTSLVGGLLKKKTLWRNPSNSSCVVIIAQWFRHEPLPLAEALAVRTEDLLKRSVLQCAEMRRWLPLCWCCLKWLHLITTAPAFLTCLCSLLVLGSDILPPQHTAA